MNRTPKLAFDIHGLPPSLAELNLARKNTTTLQFLQFQFMKFFTVAALLFSVTEIVLFFTVGDPCWINWVALWALVPGVATRSFKVTVVSALVASMILVAFSFSVALIGFGFFVALAVAALVIVVVALERSLSQYGDPGNLDSLDAEKNTDACIELDRYAQEDAAVHAYLKRVSAMGRAPVIGEFQAAKNWALNREVREDSQARIAQARAACAAWATPSDAASEIPSRGSKI